MVLVITSGGCRAGHQAGFRGWGGWASPCIAACRSASLQVQYSCRTQSSASAACRGHASHPHQLLRRGAGVQQRRAGEGWRAGGAGGVGWGAHRVGIVLPSLIAPSKKSGKATILRSARQIRKNRRCCQKRKYVGRDEAFQVKNAPVKSDQ